MIFRTAAPMTAQGPRKGEPSLTSMRNGLRPQPAHLVRGSSRRIMSMRFRPANIRVINRRASSSAVIGSAVQTVTLQAHQQERVPATPPVEGYGKCQNGARGQGFASPLRALARSAPFRQTQPCDGRLRREHFRCDWKRKWKGRLPLKSKKAGLISGARLSAPGGT
jgi:hypothetical protein